MKKMLTIFLSALLLMSAGCSSKKRSDSFIFTAGDKEIALDYDDMTFIKADGYDIILDQMMQPKSSEEDTLMLNGRIFAEITLTNSSKKEISRKDALISGLTYYPADYSDEVLFDGKPLSSSVKENCENYKGEYAYSNGYHCVLTYKDKKVVLYGNIFNIDQDRLDHITIQ